MLDSRNGICQLAPEEFDARALCYHYSHWPGAVRGSLCLVTKSVRLSPIPELGQFIREELERHGDFFSGRGRPDCRIQTRSFVYIVKAGKRPSLSTPRRIVASWHSEWSLQMVPTITAFEQSPDRGKGLARDMPVRWALEEAGESYDVRLVSFGAMKETAHRALHPFGQIPTYEEGDLVLFESGAIVFHIAERHAALLPHDANARARAISWMFAALNTVEPPIVHREVAIYAERDKTWYEEHLSVLEDRIRSRLDELSGRLGDADWLDDAFSVGDLLMVQVLRRLNGSGLLDEYPNLCAYVARGEARSAFKRAFDAQLAVFTGKPPAG